MLSAEYRVVTYIMINVALGKSDSVLQELIGLSNVRSAAVVSGIYDIICRVETPDLVTLHDITANYIHKIPGVEKTTSLVVGKELTVPEM